MRRFLPLFLLLAPLRAGEIDGAWSEGEWEEGATALEMEGGDARLRMRGRALTFAVRVPGPYEGQRIDFYVGTKSGSSACLHVLHPASHLPRLPFAPLPPVMVRRGSWDGLHRSRDATPYACRFAARVLRKGETSWTAEFAVAHEALNLPADEPAVYWLRVVDPAGKKGRPLEKAPQKWHPLAARPDPEADLFETPEENARHEFALSLFRDGLVENSLDRTFSRDRAEDIAERCDAPSFHDRWFRLHVYRRSNRLADARAALNRIVEGAPRARAYQPVVSERRQLLLLGHDYARLRETEAGAWIDRVEATWEQEKALRAKDRKDLPTIVLETTEGPVTVAVYADDGPKLADALTAWVKGGGCKDVAPAWATGGVGFAFDAPKFPKDAKPIGRRAWRGTLCVVQEKSGKLRLLLATGHVHLYRSAAALGRVVEGQDAVDRLDFADRITSARAP